ncbi:MAG: CoA-acylating methylmalonate-semialdehyde dehydrogenase [Planctomycetota bacterium]|nr:MAG: CoA-acylating methylmalonate-semialdehyde dehydrogenase [Planctomycetota bacterium]
MSEQACLSPLPIVLNGQFVESKTSQFLDLINPHTGKTKGKVPCSTQEELDAMVDSARKAQKEWANIPVKDRVQVFFKMKQLMEEREKDLAEVIHQENGKTMAEAKGSILRAIECVEFAASLPQMISGPVLEVSRGVECKMFRYPLGVVAGITPFNFPLMVPLWMVPLALACGNAFILKPSELTPLSALEIAKILKEAGLPDGLFSVIHGSKEMVEFICDHPDIKAVGFVGSTKVAKIVYARASAAGKRVRALGGAKNHLVVVPDADPEMTASNVVASVTGCTGQRCMAASVLIAVGEVDHILEKIREKMASLVPGRDIGPLISKAAKERIESYLENAEKEGAKLVLDGRKAKVEGAEGGYYLGASIIDYAQPNHRAACDEIFGPVLTVIRCKTLDQAIEIENSNPYGNAAAVYTGSGQVAQYFAQQASAGMIGINIGVPVPREPFPFGGWNDSRFGDGDITGPGAIDFWTQTKKITTKWSDQFRSNWMS